MDLAALIVSLLALALSGASAWYARKQATSQHLSTQIEADRRAEEVAGRQAEAERLRHADVDVWLSPRMQNETASMTLTNRGPAPASAVSVSFVRPLSGDGGRDGAFDRIDSRTFELHPGGVERLILTPDYDTASRYEVALRWTDDADVHERIIEINHGP